MARSDRLYALIDTLRDGDLHRAEDLAARYDVSVRTIYRDMDTLQASGIPVRGTRGTGYRAGRATGLPPLSLSDAELEALQLGIAIVSEAADPGLRAAAESLGAKIDDLLPVGPVPEDWVLATYPFADAARGFGLLAPIRAAIRGRQKLDVRYRNRDGADRSETLRPLLVEHWGRTWTLTAWSEPRAAFQVIRVDLIETVTPLPALFVDEPGKRLIDWQAQGNAPAES